MPRLLTVKEFARDLNVTASCVRRWVLLRKIKIVRVGRLVRISTEEFDRIIREGTVTARAQREANDDK